MADETKKWSVGDVVVLRSGGPQMTVDAVDVERYMRGPEDYVSCVWFEKPFSSAAGSTQRYFANPVLLPVKSAPARPDTDTGEDGHEQH